MPALSRHKSPRSESNTRPSVYETSALPTELQGRVVSELNLAGFLAGLLHHLLAHNSPPMNRDDTPLQAFFQKEF